MRYPWRNSLVAVLELGVDDNTGRAPEGKARNRSSDSRLFVNSVSGQITRPAGLVIGGGARFPADRQDIVAL